MNKVYIDLNNVKLRESVALTSTNFFHVSSGYPVWNQWFYAIDYNLSIDLNFINNIRRIYE